MLTLLIRLPSKLQIRIPPWSHIKPIIKSMTREVWMQNTYAKLRNIVSTSSTSICFDACKIKCEVCSLDDKRFIFNLANIQIIGRKLTVWE